MARCLSLFFEYASELAQISGGVAQKMKPYIAYLDTEIEKFAEGRLRSAVEWEVLGNTLKSTLPMDNLTTEELARFQKRWEWFEGNIKEIGEEPLFHGVLNRLRKISLESVELENVEKERQKTEEDQMFRRVLDKLRATPSKSEERESPKDKDGWYEVDGAEVWEEFEEI